MTGTLFPDTVKPRTTSEQYRRRLQARILRHGLCCGSVHADDALAELPIPDGVHPNAVGLAFSTLSDLRLIEPIRFQCSGRKARHKGVSRVWRVCDAVGARRYLTALQSTGDYQ